MSDAFKAFIADSHHSRYDSGVVDGWNAALDAAAKRLQDWTDFWDKQTLRDSMNDQGKLMFDAQRSNQGACIEAILRLKHEMET